jgi:DNA-binding Lrp family transcriptional regulator
VNYNLINGAFEAKLPGLMKLVLLGMIWHRNDQSGRVWVSQKTLAAELGVSFDTVARAIDKLEAMKVLVYIGEMPLNPGCVGRSTHIYEIDLKPLGLVRSERINQPIGTLRADQSGDWYADSVSKDIQSAVRPESGVGVDLSDEVEEPYRTVPFGESTSTSSSKSKPKATPSGTSSPNPDRDATQPSRTQAAPSGKATPSTSVPPAAPFSVEPSFSETEIETLCMIFSRAAYDAGTDTTIPIDPDDPTGPGLALRRYSGAFTSLNLGLLMLFAFKFSNYWLKPEAWEKHGGLSMENFLGAAPTINSQFEKWRQKSKGIAKKFTTLKSVEDFVFGIRRPTQAAGADDLGGGD